MFLLLFALNTLAIQYDGHLADAEGASIKEANVAIRIGILDVSGACTMYERSYVLDLTNSDGHFSVDLSTGTAPGAGSHAANTLSNALSNAAGNNLSCKEGGTKSYTGIFAKRKVKVTVEEIDGDIDDLEFALQDLDMTAYSLESESAKLYSGSFSGDVTGTAGQTRVEKIQGVSVDSSTPSNNQILVYSSSVGKYVPQNINSSILATDSVTVDEVDFASNNGINIPSLASAPGSPEAGQFYFNTTDKRTYFHNGSSWIDAGASGGDFNSDGSVSMTGNINLNGHYLSGDGDSEGISVDANGRVGIGTTSPAAAVDLIASRGPNQGIRISDSQDSNNSRVDLRMDNTGNGIINLYNANETLTVSINSVGNSFINTGGNLGIGTNSPQSTVEVNGTIRSAASVSNSSSTIDFSTGNLQHTSSSCGTFDLHNLKDGGTYTLAIQGTTSATCSFNAYSDGGTTALTVHMPKDHDATKPGEHTLYTLMVMGSHAYVAWMFEFD